MAFLNFIHWNIDPEIFSLGPLSIRWYGLLFALGFFIGQYIMTKIYKNEGRKPEDVDTLTIYVVIGTVVGARLGHCLFYQPEYYLADPIRILKVWEGGLASHGGAIGILLALYYYTKNRAGQSYLWVVDRLVIPVALAGSFIRLGNLMNSEIYGHETNLPWGFIFERNGETLPMHPTQIYESLAYLSIFFILKTMYNKTQGQTPHGKLLGWFLILVFGFRFAIEFLKNDQVAFEAGMLLNMGQILSIPAVLGGIFLVYRASKKGLVQEEELVK
ncbi:prolipoprotein diacylglyceryl transferase [Sediminitomix flava]|uniref:Phosphatidylglycerol--prolipoprotein diacylglyceryl transferase n=2 Tax=Sediminitomix flava TaxID=379075 RepID=A0A315Z7P3_SEDFL|nr:prolipoprotein diacylglyceryl transferase [Sediminitomix flava]